MKTQGKLHKQEPNLNLASPSLRTSINDASHSALSLHPEENQNEKHCTVLYGTGHSISFCWFAVSTSKKWGVGGGRGEEY